MVLLLDVISKIIDHDIDDIAGYLFFPHNRERLESILKGLRIQTTYKNRKESRHIFYFSGLSIQDAKHLKAYKGYLGITVTQHYYARHRIRIQHHNLPYAIEYDNHGNASYYPLELLELVLSITFQRNVYKVKEWKSQDDIIDDDNHAKIFYFEYSYL